MDNLNSNTDDVTLKFDVEDMKDLMLEREYVKDLMDEEEGKLFDDHDDDHDNFFNGEGYQNLIKECGVTSQDLYKEVDIDTSDSTPLMKYKSLTHKMTDISNGEKLIFKRLISKGEGPKVPEGSLVIYNYKFYHEHQIEPFDSTRFKKRPDRQRVGVGQMLPGLDVALQSMCKKERANFVFDSSVMFGELGVAPRIPGFADIYAEVEVVDFTEKNLIDEFFEKTADERMQMTFEEMVKLVVQCRQDANVAVRNKRFGVALNKYFRGMDILQVIPVSNDEEDNIRSEHVVKLQLNMAHCNLKLNRGPAAIKSCNSVLLKKPKNPKALYRKAKGLMIIGEYDDAARNLALANKYLPNDKEILKAISTNEELKKQYVENEKLLAMSMLKMNQENVKPPRKSRVVDLDTELAADLRNQIANFRDSEETKVLSNLSGLSLNEIDVVKALCNEYNLYFNEHEGVIKKK